MTLTREQQIMRLFTRLYTRDMHPTHAICRLSSVKAPKLDNRLSYLEVSHTRAHSLRVFILYYIFIAVCLMRVHLLYLI